MRNPPQEMGVWVLASALDEGAFERLGDARGVADGLDTGVGVWATGVEASQAQRLIAGGADRVCFTAQHLGLQSRVAAAASELAGGARLVVAAGDCRGREWAARLAVRLGWRLVSPALMIEVVDDEGVEVTGLDHSGRLARHVRMGPDDPAVLTLRAGVGQARAAEAGRRGEIVQLEVTPEPEPVSQSEVIPADPATVDIRFAERLVAGGRGVGSKAGFDTLRRFADKIGASLAASRMAVDLGWIESERQVGQTGKTVAPDLYIACGISGASHHLAGMSGAARVVAINSDPAAPIFKAAHLGLVADLHEVLSRAEAGLRE